jgi:hypothetical protein
MTTGLEDANEDTYLISSSEFFLGRGLSIKVSENKGMMAEEASLSFSSSLPQDASRSFSARDQGGDQDRRHQRCGSLY